MRSGVRQGYGKLPVLILFRLKERIEYLLIDMVLLATSPIPRRPVALKLGLPHPPAALFLWATEQPA